MTTSDKINIQLSADSEDVIAQMLLDTATKYRKEEGVCSFSLSKGERLSLLVEIETDNAAFSELPYDLESNWNTIRATSSQIALVTETCRILEDLASKLTIATACRLLDINGNPVGQAVMKEQEFPAED
jgi:hypothetical protein